MHLVFFLSCWSSHLLTKVKHPLSPLSVQVQNDRDKVPALSFSSLLALLNERCDPAGVVRQPSYWAQAFGSIAADDAQF